MLSKLLNRGTQVANDLKSGVLKFKSKDFLKASIAGAFMVSAADGDIDSDEKKKLLAFVKTDESLSVYDSGEVASAFKEFEDAYDFDADAGKAQAMKAISRIAGSDEKAKFVVRMIIAIGKADGEFDANEKDVVREICRELGLKPSEFDL